MHYRITDKKAAEIEARADKAILRYFLMPKTLQLIDDIVALLLDRKAITAELKFMSRVAVQDLDNINNLTRTLLNLQTERDNVVNQNSGLASELFNAKLEIKRLATGIELRDDKARVNIDYGNCGYCPGGCGDDCPVKTHPATKEPRQ
jgi:hypothetical protein